MVLERLQFWQLYYFIFFHLMILSFHTIINMTFFTKEDMVLSFSSL